MQAHRSQAGEGAAVGSLFHFMQTLTHIFKEFKNTPTPMVSVPTSPRNTDTWLSGVGPEGPKASVLGQGSSGAWVVGRAASFSPEEKCRQDRGPRQRGPTLTADWQRAGVLHSGRPQRGLHLAPVGCSSQKVGSGGTPGMGQHGGPGSWSSCSVLGLLQAPLESMVLVGIRQDLVAHPPEQVGCGL